MQTVADFVTNPQSGIGKIDDTVTPYPSYMITGTKPPQPLLAYLPTIADQTSVWNPLHYLWRRPATRLTR